MATPTTKTDAPSFEQEVEIDPDGDPAGLHPRDLRGIRTRDGVTATEDPDADPELLNPHGS